MIRAKGISGQKIYTCPMIYGPARKGFLLQCRALKIRRITIKQAHGSIVHFCRLKLNLI